VTGPAAAGAPAAAVFHVLPGPPAGRKDGGSRRPYLLRHGASPAPDDTEEHGMTTTTTPRQARNGVDVPTLFATLDAVKATPEIAAFQFRARNRWISGTHSRSTISGFTGAMQEMQHEREHTYDADHPAVLVGKDTGPTPVEFLLHAIAACITAGLANIAAARGITLTEVSSTVEGDIDLRGILGISDEVRNGYSGIRVCVDIKGDADAETLRGLVEQSRRRSAVYDVLTNGVPVEVDVTTA
jgi:uncharacterized OsmC-like protein